MNLIRTSFFVTLMWLCSVSFLRGQDEVTYGFLQNSECSTEITAVAYPNFTSNNVTISTSVFTFLVPEGTATDPAITPVPSPPGSFNNITGTWAVQYLTEDVYDSFAGTTDGLGGKDVFQVILQNSPSPITSSGQPLSLFSFSLPSDCMGGNIEVLTNDSQIAMDIFSVFGANPNNQMSISIDDAPADDKYVGNDPASFSISCPLVEEFNPLDDTAEACGEAPINIDVLANDEGLVCIDETTPLTITVNASNGTATVDDGGTPDDPRDDTIEFAANPGFVGVETIIYQICNVDGDCETAIIRITVFDLPTVNPEVETVDIGATVMISGNATPGGGTIVSHSWAISDGGTTGITPANLSNENMEDLTVDATGLSSGTVTLSYSVADDNGCMASGTTTLTVNDLPVANDDVATTDENTPVNIPVLVNDDFGGDGPGTGPITVTVGASNGTATVNDGGTPNDPTDDTIDYTPDAGFSGTDMFSYQICDSNGDCDDAEVTVTVLDAVIGVAKSASPVINNMDGTFTTTITLTLENFGATILGDVQVTDDLSAFGLPGDLDMADEYAVSNLMMVSNSADPLSVNAGFNGAGDVELLDVSAGGTLAIGEVATLSFDLTFNPSQSAYENTAVASGDVPANDDPTGMDDDDPDDTTDDSTDGTDPDPNDDDDPEEDVPTPIDPDDVPEANDDVATTDESTPVNIPVLINDDFGIDGPGMGPITITVDATNGTATVNDGGTPNDPTDDTIDYTPDPGFDGTDMITYQICDSDGDCDDAVVTVTVLEAVIGIAKAASVVIDNQDGTFTTTITLTLENFGATVLGDVQVTDDLSAFGLPGDLDAIDEYAVSNLMMVSNSADPLSVNSGFNGASDLELLDVSAGGTLAIGEVATLSFDLTFNPSQTEYENTAVASGDVSANDDPTGMDDDDPDDTSDDSTDGTDPDPNDDADPEEEIPTPIEPDFSPLAVDDVATTDENTPVNIPVLVNDDFGNDGPGTGPITITVDATNGTATVNDGGTPDDPTDDTIDYTPDPGFDGTDMITYQICDSDGDCDDAVVTVTVLDAQIGVAKSASPVINNMDGTFTTTITLTLENFGATVLGDIQVTDDLSAFGLPGDLDAEDEYAVSNLMMVSNSADPLSVNAGFNGAGDVELLDVSAGGTLAIGEVATLSFDLTFNPSQSEYENTAVASGDVPANDDPTGMDDDDPDDTSDDSTDGTDPDPNDDDDPEEDVPTPIDPDDTPEANDDVATTDENTPINIGVLVNDDFGVDGPGVGPITITVDATNGTATVNDGGTPNDPTDDTIDYVPDPGFDGTDMITYQICDSDGDCDDAVVTVTVLDAQIGVAKSASPVINNMDGTFTTTITLTLENFGATVLGDIQVTDDLSAFGLPGDLDTEDEYAVSNLMMVSNSADPLSVNAGFNGAGDVELLDVSAGGTLAIGEVATLSFDLTFNPSQSDYENTAVASGDVPANDDPTGMDDDDPDDTSDDSTDGTDPDPNDDDDPEEYVPTPIDPDDTPEANDDVATTNENTPVNVDVLDNDDFGVDGPGMGPITVTIGATNGTATVNDGGTPNDPTDDTVDYTPDAGFFGTDQFTYQICDVDGDCDDAVVTITVNPTSVKLLVKMQLQGALLGSPDGLMRDDLRAQDHLPASEPYGALAGFVHVNNDTDETIADPGTVFGDYDENSIVDWVFVELRDPSNPDQVVATRSGLVQRDGDVVDLDGTSPLCFPGSLPDQYYVSVRHRNHLGTMTADPFQLMAEGTLVDFTDTSLDLWNNFPVLDGVEQITVDGKYALWAGNTNLNNSVIFAGQQNDKNPIFNEVDQAPGNVFRFQTFVLPGYFLGDVNMDGNSIFAGQNNDVDPIFNNVDGHPRNTARFQTFVILEQLPE
ncbi:Ig-like domain-containing protein [Lewinella sp. W8]|uniref:Ig-like domain-containing protein n=1 Tax=Lewinella sp. W8 TaxID=2528208 RepID=UPI00106840E4|nr:Ig-like domain-containing protein [Lewinella sp. W8]MTB53976.1 hypothetical protein [Lewinella sp. W8]